MRYVKFGIWYCPTINTMLVTDDFGNLVSVSYAINPYSLIGVTE